ncbi:MAG: hypothetical protein IJT06_05440, partial [Selenomonadaceae bacterium]|nr:hypothetical protein [Selenomonadaceae bacterium]
MSKIFVAFRAGKDYGVTRSVLPPFYEGFLTALQACGHELAVIPHNISALEWGGAQHDIATRLTQFNPDLCILFNNAFFDISEIVSCPILVVSADSILYFSNKTSIKNNPSRYFFFVDKSTAEVLIKNFGVEETHITDYIPFSIIQPEKRPLEQNIVFIGGQFGVKPISPTNYFMNEKPTAEQRAEFLNALDYLKENPFVEPQEFISKKIITSELVAKYFNIPHFIMELSVEKRVQVLSAVADLGFTLYGSDEWERHYLHSSKLTLSYSHKRVFTVAENAAAYNSSKIGISVGHLQAVYGFPWRILDIMRSNACLVSDYHKDFDKFFPEDLFPVYEDEYEAREICKEL